MHACDRRVHASCTFVSSSTRTYLVRLPMCMYRWITNDFSLLEAAVSVEIVRFVSLVCLFQYIYIYPMNSRREKGFDSLSIPLLLIDRSWGFIKNSCIGISFVSVSSIERYFLLLSVNAVCDRDEGSTRGTMKREKLDLLYCAQVSLFVNYPRCINAIECPCRDGIPRKINSRLFVSSSSPTSFQRLS